jgi:hypothetical protein
MNKCTTHPARRFLALRAPAFPAIPGAPAWSFFRRNNHLAAVGSEFKTSFPLEEQPVRGKHAKVQLAAKSRAAERMYFMQIVGVDKNAPFAVVFFVKKVNQLPGGASVEIASRTNVEVAVAYLVLDEEICAHSQVLLSPAHRRGRHGISLVELKSSPVVH